MAEKPDAPEKPIHHTNGSYKDEESRGYESLSLSHPNSKHPEGEETEFDENNAPVQSVINTWAESTSIHGVPFVSDPATWKLWKRGVWLTLVLVSSGLMIFQISKLISQFNSYEVTTNTETFDPVSLEFPEISVCNLNAFSKKLMNETGISDPLNEDQLMQISTPLESFIKETSFNEEDLNVSQVWHSRIAGETTGRCWYFNTDERVWSPGYNAGLRLMVDTEQDDYDDNAYLAGIVIYAEQRGSIIGNQVAPAAAIKPGKVALVNMKKKQVIREREAPWSRCFSDAPNYTQARCRNECVYADIRKSCGCRRYADKEEPDMRYCQPNENLEDHECATKSVKNVETILQGCSCDLPTCSETTYPSSVVEVDRPKGWYDRFEKSSPQNVTKAYLSENYVLVTINFAELQYEVLTESKAVTPAQLLGSIGGSMGFFLGISFISVLELFGDLVPMRLLPRLCGQRHLLGVGARKKS